MFRSPSPSKGYGSVTAVMGAAAMQLLHWCCCDQTLSGT